MISKHNKLFKEGNLTFKIGINQFADMTFEEVSRLNAINETIEEITDDIPYDPIVFEVDECFEVPEAFDWRDVGAVTPVKNQLKCGSCYAMATIGSVEGQVFIKTGKLSEFSTQEIIDCAGKYQTWGCDGGLKFGIFDFIKENNVLCLESDYPYNGVQGECKSSKFSKFKVSLKTFGEVPANDENILKLALVKVGPLAISIDSNHESFTRYSSGIYFEPNCTKNINHAVLLIGYGSEKGNDFWIVKNSYGEAWGENGIIRIARNKNNHCGIASDSLYPIIN